MAAARRTAATAAPVPGISNPFDTPLDSALTPTAPPIDPAQLSRQLLDLQRTVQVADRERAAAEAQLAQAQRDLTEIDAGLRSLKVNPDKAGEALTQFEQQLAALATQLEATVAAEREQYRQIAAAAAL